MRLHASRPGKANSPESDRLFVLTRTSQAESTSILHDVRPFSRDSSPARQPQGFTVHDALRSPGRPLEEPVRIEMEQRLGADFSQVRVHTDAAAHESAQDVNAHAYTAGSHLVFQQGQYDGASAAGKKMLAHELTHVIQQRQGPVSGTSVDGGPVVSDPRDTFEQAAEATAESAMARPLHATPAAGGPAAHAGPAPAGSAAVSGVVVGPVAVQRSLKDKGGIKRAYGDVSGSSKVSNAALVVRKVIQWWADGSTSPPVSYNTYGDLVQQAALVAANPPTQFIDVLDEEGLESLLTYPARKKNPLSAAQNTAIDARRRALARVAVAALGHNPQLHVPTHDPHYRTPTEAHLNPLHRTGRQGGEWKSVPADTVAGLGAKTTGSVNRALIEELMLQGNWEKVGDIHVQICPGCGGGQNVELLEVDHQQALSDIRDKLWLLADAMSADLTLHDEIKKNTHGFADLFTVKPSKTSPTPDVTPTQAALSIFSNDLGNVMRICRVCNGATNKSDIAFLDWFRNNKFFGPDFLAENLPLAPTGDVLARTKHDTGWGKAARDWFARHHLPTLKETFKVTRLERLANRSLVDQSLSMMNAQFEPDVTRKRKHEDKASELKGLNKAIGGVSEVVADYITQGPTPFAPGSPERMVEAFSQVTKRREKRKRLEEAKASDPFTTGWIAGREDFPFDISTYLTETEVSRYHSGYSQGRYEAAEQHDQGYGDALQADASPDPWAAKAYEEGFQRATTFRERAYALGAQDGAMLLPPNPAKIPRGVTGEAVLLRDYMDGYSKGMLDRAKPTPPPTPEPGKDM